MKVGIGYTNNHDSFVSGKIAAEAALAGGKIEKPAFILAFSHHQVDAEAFFRGLRTVVGAEPPIIGGSAVGVITNDVVSYEGFPAGVAVLQSDGLDVEIACSGDLDLDERRAGKRLADKLVHKADGKLLLIFYDSVKTPPTASMPPVMNASPPLIQGLEEGMPSSVPILGAGLVGDFAFNPPKQFNGYAVAGQHVVGALFSGACHHYYQIMHGMTPLDGIRHTITKMEGALIHEVDGRPVAEMIDAMYGNQNWREQSPVRRLAIGIDHGDPYGDYREEHYVGRLITGVFPNGKGIAMFEPDLDVGTEFLFMLRDSGKMMESAAKNCSDLIRRIEEDGKRPVFGCYIDCAGRTALASDTLHEEADIIREHFNRIQVPLLGFYSGVEVAPLLGKSRGLDWTGVLWVMAEG
ncbi:MAG: FIST N-terminal domain-containing protein [Syntrophales bacterium]|jgi:hypothetical protein|nr:FIST N-terminal domain-containing protein [Syntrophales bacterium]